jgi:hypothetical protein
MSEINKKILFGFIANHENLMSFKGELEEYAEIPKIKIKEYSNNLPPSPIFKQLIEKTMKKNLPDAFEKYPGLKDDIHKLGIMEPDKYAEFNAEYSKLNNEVDRLENIAKIENVFDKNMFNVIIKEINNSEEKKLFKNIRNLLEVLLKYKFLLDKLKCLILNFEYFCEKNIINENGEIKIIENKNDEENFNDYLEKNKNNEEVFSDYLKKNKNEHIKKNFIDTYFKKTREYVIENIMLGVLLNGYLDENINEDKNFPQLNLFDENEKVNPKLYEIIPNTGKIINEMEIFLNKVKEKIRPD